MIDKIRYMGRNEDQEIGYMSLPISQALELGLKYKDKDGNAEMEITSSEKLKFLMHRHCKHLKVKLNFEHRYTIAELYEVCPAILLDLLELYGGIEYLAETLIGYDQLYNEEQMKSQWEGKLQ